MSSIRQIAYEKYKFDWLINHGYTLTDLIREILYGLIINSIQGKHISAQLALSTFEECGFNGEIWSCYEEFLSNEYQDIEYIKSILNEKEFESYIREEFN